MVSKQHVCFFLSTGEISSSRSISHTPHVFSSTKARGSIGINRVQGPKDSCYFQCGCATTLRSWGHQGYPISAGENSFQLLWKLFNCQQMIHLLWIKEYRLKYSILELRVFKRALPFDVILLWRLPLQFNGRAHSRHSLAKASRIAMNLDLERYDCLFTHCIGRGSVIFSNKLSFLSHRWLLVYSKELISLQWSRTLVYRHSHANSLLLSTYLKVENRQNVIEITTYQVLKAAFCPHDNLKGLNEVSLYQIWFEVSRCRRILCDNIYELPNS